MAGSSIQNNNQFLAGGGEMGKLTRAYDWNKSILGEPSSWPQSLKTTLGLLLNSKFPMFLFWGQELTCFYNDAYRPSLGKNGKHPSILGMRGEDAWPEIWHIIKPLIDQVLETGEATWHEHQLIPIYRNGKIEDVYWTFSYSPVKDESGNNVAAFVTCNETTKDVLTLKKLEEAENRFRSSLLQAPVGIAILKGEKFIVELANDTYLQLIDRKKEDFINHPLFDSLPEVKSIVGKLLKSVLKTGIAYHGNELEIPINRYGREEKGFFNFVYQPLKEADESISGIMVIVTEVTVQAEARKKIEESESRLSMAIDVTKLGTWDYSPLTGKLTWSKECRDIYAIPADVEIDFDLFAEHIHSEDREFALGAIQKAMDPAGVGTYDIIYRILRFTDKSPRWIRAQGRIYFNINKQAERFIGTVLDITDSKISEEESAMKAAIVQSSEDAIISKTIQSIVTSWNIAAERIFGYTADEMVGQSILKLLPKDRIDEETHILNRLKKGERVEHFETKRIRKDGKLIDVSITISPIKDASGKILGASKIARDVTEQKISEQKLQESEVRLRLATEGTRLATWDLNLETKEIIYSSRLAEIFGHEATKVFSHADMREQIIPEDREAIVEKAFDDAMMTGTYYYEARILKPDNNISWIRTQGKVIFSDSGMPLRMIGTMIDITEERNSITVLEDSKLRMNIAIEAAELGTWELDLDTRQAVYSKRYLEIFGFGEFEKPVHSELLKRIHPEDMKVRDEAVLQAYKTGFLDVEMRLVTGKINIIRWIKVKGKVFYNADKEPMKMMGTVADVTSQKLYENNLRDSEEKFRLLADSMPQHIWTGDTVGVLNYFNKSVYDFSGLSPEQLDSGGWLQIIHPDDREENIKKWMEAVTSGEPFLFEHRFRRYDGEYRWQLSRAIPQKDSRGKIQMWVGTSTDIDEIKRHEQQKDDFIKMASHELKTPITTVKGYVQLLLKTHGAGSDTFLSGSLMTIDRQILKLTKLITDLLDVTKIETGSLQLSKEVFAVSEVINETALDTDAAHTSHSVMLNLHDDPTIFADKDRISQVLSNLFTNAIKYSPKADKIIVDVKQRGNEVIISVKDFGIGIAPEDHGKIFDRFFRAAGKDEKTFPGFGIGLFIVNEILSLHNGKIWVESEKDNGAVFYFSLPVNKTI
jgi:PAS domain S-box-containing protein